MAHLLENGTEVEGRLDLSPEPVLAYIQAVLEQSNLRSLRNLGVLSTLVGGLGSAILEDPYLRQSFGASILGPLQAACQAIAKR